MLANQIPTKFSDFIQVVLGEPGRTWLAQLPALLDECAERWSLKIAPPFDLSWNYVAPAVRADGTALVLKMSMPGDSALLNEMNALRFYDGQGMARLLDSAPELGAMLLERVQPGVPLSEQLLEYSSQADDAATLVVAQVMQRIWKPLPASHTFQTVEQWTSSIKCVRERFNGGTGPFPSRYIDQAERLFADLIASSGETVLLHADLHHYNVLKAEREPWLVIDPKGVAGEREYEVGPLMYNPTYVMGSWPNLSIILARRLDLLSEVLRFDRQRMLDWCFAQAVLSAWWSFDDGEQVGEDWLLIPDALFALYK